MFPAKLEAGNKQSPEVLTEIKHVLKDLSKQQLALCSFQAGAISKEEFREFLKKSNPHWAEVLK